MRCDAWTLLLYFGRGIYKYITLLEYHCIGLSVSIDTLGYHMIKN